MKNLRIVFFLFFYGASFGQINTTYIAPSVTDVNYASGENAHCVVKNIVDNKNKLFLFIGGSFSAPFSYQGISNYAGLEGFDVINISYPNSVPAAVLGNSTEELAFDFYREEICFGTPLSNAVDVDTFNSIYTRSVKLLEYLVITYPEEDWGQYLLDSGDLDWSKILVGGHSQGGGHAAYFAKKEEVQRVLMFSSPNDYSDFFEGPAHWLGEESATDVNRYFAYLSLWDEVFPFSKQLANISEIGVYPLFDTVLVDIVDVPFDQSRCLYTTQDPGVFMNHSATIISSDLNKYVWTYMLNAEITSSDKNLLEDRRVVIFPNPTRSSIHVSFQARMIGGNFTIRNINGQVVQQGKVPNADLLYIDLDSLPKGMYVLNINGYSSSFMKL